MLSWAIDVAVFQLLLNLLNILFFIALKYFLHFRNISERGLKFKRNHTCYKKKTGNVFEILKETFISS